jgi:hypothetical protein
MKNTTFKYYYLWQLALGLLLLLNLTSLAYADIFTGQIVGVTDGDTVTLLDDNRSQY